MAPAAEGGARRILFSSPFVPAEWIATHDLAPVRFTPRGGPTSGPVADREGVCPFTRAFVNEACAVPDLAGLVLVTTCDPMRRAFDEVKRQTEVPVFLLDVPATWRTPGPHALYRAELERLGGFLLARGGRSPGRDELARRLLAAGAPPGP
ncbi:MAG: 2-hydroxyacyl-CoA dehydratase family protein, partial [Planctomycetota bacterium]